MTCECGNELSPRTAFLVNGELLCGSCRAPARGAFPRPRPAVVDQRERAVVWEHPGTGAIRYPGRNDVAMPERYAREGFERREFQSLRELQAFETRSGTRNEAVWFDRGSGREF